MSDNHLSSDSDAPESTELPSVNTKPPPAARESGKFFRLLLLLLIVVDLSLIGVLYTQIDGHIKEPYETTNLLMVFGIVIAIIIVSLSIIKIYNEQYSNPSAPIPADDRKLLEELIRAEKTKGIELYIQVASLKGPTKAATTLGLTGLPLATIGLTIFFSLIALVKPDSNFLDLAKLTLGAFIGSFVQRSNEAIDRAVRATSSPESLSHAAALEAGEKRGKNPRSPAGKSAGSGQ